MGDMNAVSNLGYCYLYGRDIEQNTSLAIAYFKTAAENGVIDAMYKLGDIYSSDKWNVKDVELSLYYYNTAFSRVVGGEWESNSIVYCEGLQYYPSLCYALGREMSRGGRMNTDIVIAYQLLKHAEKGYRKEIDNGAVMYESSYEGVKKLLADSQFDGIRREYDAYFAGEDYDEEAE
jgi:TPR repeat protein